MKFSNLFTAILLSTALVSANMLNAAPSKSSSSRSSGSSWSRSSSSSSRSSSSGWGSSSKSSSSSPSKSSSSSSSWGSSSKSSSSSPSKSSGWSSGSSGSSSSTPKSSTFSSSQKSENSATKSSGWGSSSAGSGWGSSSKSVSANGSTSYKAPTATDNALRQKALQSGTAYKTKDDAINSFKSKNADKFPTKFSSEPKTRPDYIPNTYTSGGNTYNVVYNSNFGGYGYYNGLGAWIAYDVMTDALMMNALMARNSYYYPGIHHTVPSGTVVYNESPRSFFWGFFWITALILMIFFVGWMVTRNV